ncbi:MAG: DUF1800 domain-containing protein [Rubrivivax sp.]
MSIPTADAPAAAAPAATALGAALLLAACGGGGDPGVEAALARRAEAPTRRDILGVPPLPARAAAPPALPTATELLDWAELHYPQYFPGHEADRSFAPYTYRLYAATGNAAGVADGRVYILGPVAGNDTVPVDVGALADFAPWVYARRWAYDDLQAARFLLQATLGATDADIAAVRSQGYEAWLDAQIATPPSSGNWAWLESKGLHTNPDARNAAIGVDAQVWQRLISAPDSLRQRVALALSEIFVVGFDGLSGIYKQFKLAAFWDLLAQHAFGSYRTLLEAVTLNAAMGNYLNTAGNQKENAATGRLPDENYAREVMQLFSIGLLQLNEDGSARIGPDGEPLESYTQDDVTQLARVFTGWNYDGRRGDTGPEAMGRPMVLNAALHSTLAASFLGVTVAAGTDGTAALRIALDRLAAHPNVGPFIGRQLIQRLVTSNPSPAYVARVARAFADNGRGVRGDLGAVVKAVLLDDEARSPAGLGDARFGKLREPLLRLLGWARSFKASSLSTDWTLGNLSDPSTRLGQSPQRAPSVFNFFRPGYVPAGTAIGAAGLVAPEFQIANESSVAGYLNFMLGVSAGRHADLRPDYGAERAVAADATALVARVERLLCAGQLGAEARSTIVAAVASLPASTSTQLDTRVASAVYLVLAAPDAMVQR